ncbi:MAG: 16S rRNA processing protein RimM [Lachnospiraceae bacterium]|nr:16S rRNA processing protein RimM [Lachnospiraceae bacterium]
MEDLLRVGVITTTHGVFGEVKVFPTTDEARRFDDLKTAVLKYRNGEMDVHIVGVKYFKNLVILKLEEITSVEQARLYRNAELYVRREDAVPLEEGEYYIGDLIGLSVVTDEGKTLGTLTDVMETGANDVYIVTTPEKKEILLPAIDECILDIDLENGICRVHVMKGLLD